MNILLRSAWSIALLIEVLNPLNCIYLYIYKKRFMFKIISIGVLLFLLYRLVVTPKTIDKGYQGEIENDTDDDFVEYEEVD